MNLDLLPELTPNDLSFLPFIASWKMTDEIKYWIFPESRIMYLSHEYNCGRELGDPERCVIPLWSAGFLWGRVCPGGAEVMLSPAG